MHVSEWEAPERNVSEGLRWLQMAANKGDALAQLNLAVCYRLGVGVARSDTEARK